MFPGPDMQERQAVQLVPEQQVAHDHWVSGSADPWRGPASLPMYQTTRETAHLCQCPVADAHTTILVAMVMGRELRLKWSHSGHVTVGLGGFKQMNARHKVKHTLMI